VTDHADTPAPQPAPGPSAQESAAAAAAAAERPELMLGAAFAGGLLAALILKRLAR
jgi:predicted lipid-binding transport protein (Tim44 family)